MPGGGAQRGTWLPWPTMHEAYSASNCCWNDICAQPALAAFATVPNAAPEAAPIPAPRPPPTAPPIAAPSAVEINAPPTAWLLAAATAGAICEEAYCWQKAWSALNAAGLLPGPGTTGIVGATGGATQPAIARRIAAAATARGSIRCMGSFPSDERPTILRR